MKEAYPDYTDEIERYIIEEYLQELEIDFERGQVRFDRPHTQEMHDEWINEDLTKLRPSEKFLSETFPDVVNFTLVVAGEYWDGLVNERMKDFYNELVNELGREPTYEELLEHAQKKSDEANKEILKLLECIDIEGNLPPECT